MKSTVLIEDPILGKTFQLLEELFPEVDFTLSVEVSKFGIDPIIPRYTVSFSGIITIGPLTTPEELLTLSKKWFAENPMELEEQEEEQEEQEEGI